jgi:hypothetical protein
MPINQVPLNEFLIKNLIFHVIMEREVECTPFGTITFNFEVNDGVVRMDTLNVVKNRRLRYSGNQTNHIDEQ